MAAGCARMLCGPTKGNWVAGIATALGLKKAVARQHKPAGSDLVFLQMICWWPAENVRQKNPAVDISAPEAEIGRLVYELLSMPVLD